MARNKSEKRSPSEQKVFDYIEAWVEFSCTETGAYKPGIIDAAYSRGPGSHTWETMSQEVRTACQRILHRKRWEWLRAQKQK